MQRILICGLIMACLLAAPAQAQWEYDVDDLSTLLEMLESDQPVVRQLGATGICLIDSFVAQAAVPPLLAELVASDDMFIQEAAIMALGRIGPAASDALDELEALLADPAVAPLAERAIEIIRGIAASQPDTENMPAEQESEQ